MGAKQFAVNNSAAASVTFLPSVALKDGNQYLDSATALTSPRGAVVKHTMAPLSEQRGVDRHYVQFTKTVYSNLGIPSTAAIAVSVVIPRVDIVSADVEDLRAFAKNFIGDATIFPAMIKGDY